jgi:hypothetical protein
LVNRRSYAIATSPAAVNWWGRAEVICVSDTLNSVDASSVTLNKLPTVPFGPMFILTRSPVAVVALPGDQSMFASFPVEKLVEVDVRERPVPVVKLSASRV